VRDAGSESTPCAFWRLSLPAMCHQTREILCPLNRNARRCEPLGLQRPFTISKEEIEKLTAQQTEARNLAIYVGMTPDEAAEYDERRGRSLSTFKT